MERLPSNEQFAIPRLDNDLTLEHTIKLAQSKLSKATKASARELLELQDTFSSDAATKAEAVLTKRQLLQDMTTPPTTSMRALSPSTLPWIAFPARCDALFCNCTAEHAVDRMSGSEAVSKLKADWEKRHTQLEAAPRLAIPAVRVNQCRLGVCVCARAEPDMQRMRTRMQTWCKGLQPPHIMTLGNAILQWRCYWLAGEEADATSCGSGLAGEIMYTHISLCNLKPFRPILMKLDQPDADVLRFTATEGEDNCPMLFTLFEWLLELNKNAAWDVHLLVVSEKMTPVPHLHGSVWAEVTAAPPLRVWQSAILEARGRIRRRRRAPLHEVLLAARPGGNQAPAQRVHQPPNEAEQEEEGPESDDACEVEDPIAVADPLLEEGEGPEEVGWDIDTFLEAAALEGRDTRPNSNQSRQKQ